MATLANRNNNPGNLRDRSTGEFRVFPTYGDGMAALMNDLEAKRSGNTVTGLGPDSTLYEFSQKYAPEGDDNDPAQYTANLANRLNVAPDTRLADLDVGLWADAVAGNEGYVHYPGLGQFNEPLKPLPESAPPVPQIPQAPQAPQTQEKKPGLLKRIGSALIQSETRFGEDLAGAASTYLPGSMTGADDLQAANAAKEQGIQTALKGLERAKSTGGNVDKWLKILSDQTGQPVATLEDLYPALKRSDKQVIGNALGVAADIATAGTYGKGFQTAKLGKGLPAVLGGAAQNTFLKGAIKGGAKGLGSGAISGSLQGFARGLQDDKTLAQSGAESVKGGVIGGALGGTLGALVGGTTGFLTGRAQRKAELLALKNSGSLADSRLAALDPITLKADPLAKEVLKQGVDESYVGVMKAGSNADKVKYNRMLNIAQKASTDKRAIERPFDVVGSTILEPAKHIENVMKKAGAQLDDVAEGLKGQFDSDSYLKTLQSFDDDLDRIGAKVTNEGIDFSGSTLEDIGGNAKIIDNVHKRMLDVTDSYDLHRLKKYIDTNVEYGKSSEGLVGEAERILKGWRSAIDNALDTQFDEYNKINTLYSTSINQLDELNGIMGRSFKVSDSLANVKAGQVGSRILSNSVNRGEVMSTLNNLQKTAKDLGYAADDDIVNQVLFADFLNDLYPTQATTGFGGQIERSINKATRFGTDLAAGKPIRAVVGLAADSMDFIRGIDQESKIKAIRALIQPATTQKSVGILGKLLGSIRASQ